MYVIGLVLYWVTSVLLMIELDIGFVFKRFID